MLLNTRSSDIGEDNNSYTMGEDVEWELLPTMLDFYGVILLVMHGDLNLRLAFGLNIYYISCKNKLKRNPKGKSRDTGNIGRTGQRQTNKTRWTKHRGKVRSEG